MVDGNEEHAMSTFARLNTQEVPAPRDFSDFWQEPTSSFLASGRCPALCVGGGTPPCSCTARRAAGVAAGLVRQRPVPAPAAACRALPFPSCRGLSKAMAERRARAQAR